MVLGPYVQAAGAVLSLIGMYFALPNLPLSPQSRTLERSKRFNLGLSLVICGMVLLAISGLFGFPAASE
jgi:hypothetical protein